MAIFYNVLYDQYVNKKIAQKLRSGSPITFKTAISIFNEDRDRDCDCDLNFGDWAHALIILCSNLHKTAQDLMSQNPFVKCSKEAEKKILLTKPVL